MNAESEARLREGTPLTIYAVSSAGPRAQRIVLSATFGALALTGGAFAVKGAWPIAVMTSTTGSLLIGAFALSNRKNRQYQQLVLEGPHLHIDTQLPYRQHVSRVSLQANWARAQMAPEDRAIQPHGPDSLMEVTERLCVTDGRRRVYVGDFLPPGERPALKIIIENGLRDHGNGVPRVCI